MTSIPTSAYPTSYPREGGLNRPVTIHFPKPKKVHRRASFVGSYSANIRPERGAWQDKIFEAPPRSN